MKRLSFSLFFSLFLSLISCNEKIGMVNDNPLEMDGYQNGEYVLTSEDFQFFGEAHNLGLHFIYENYITSLTELPNTTVYDYSIFKLTSYFFNEIYEPTKECETINISQHPKNNIDSLIQCNFSIEQQDIIIKIKEVFKFENPQAALQELTLIDNNISMMIEDDQQIQLWCMVAVARHSIQYWTSSQGEDWISKIKYLSTEKIGDNSPIQGINWGTVAEKDFDGFISGVTAYGLSGAWKKDVVVGAISAALGTGGIGLVGGAILKVCGGAAKWGIATATAMSAGSIAFQLFTR